MCRKSQRFQRKHYYVILPRPLDEEPGLMIQIFITPSTIDSVLIFRIFSSVWLHSANNEADVLADWDAGDCKKNKNDIKMLSMYVVL